MPTIHTRDTLDIETSGATTEIKTHGNDRVSVYIRGDGTADYVVDVNDDPDENAWIQDVEDSLLTGSTDYDETFATGAAHVRVRVTSGTTSAGDTADVYLASGGT